MRALSITRPWTELILRRGKPVENRTWPTYYRGLLLVHGAQSWQGSALGYAEELGITGLSWDRADYPMGIVGVVTVTGVCQESKYGRECGCGPWSAHGQCHWQLANPRPLEEPIPCKGALGLWQPSIEVEAAVRAQGVLAGA